MHQKLSRVDRLPAATLLVCMEQVITKRVDDKLHEPFEEAMVELPEAHVGSAVDLLGQRKGTMLDLSNSTGGLTRLTYRIPTRCALLDIPCFLWLFTYAGHQSGHDGMALRLPCFLSSSSPRLGFLVCGHQT